MYVSQLVSVRFYATPKLHIYLSLVIFCNISHQLMLTIYIHVHIIICPSIAIAI